MTQQQQQRQHCGRHWRDNNGNGNSNSRHRSYGSSWPLLVLLMLMLVSTVSAFTPSKNHNYCRRPRAPLRMTALSSSKRLDVKKLERELAGCETETAARRVLEATFLSTSTTSSSRTLYKSLVIPPQSSSKGLSDGDLAIQTRIRNSRYSIWDLIELDNGNRDANRASVAVLSVFCASTVSAIVADQNLPGPEILRFLVVWAFSFAPLALVGYGMSTPQSLQAVLMLIQQSLFPQYRQRIIQHEAGHFLMSHLLGFPIQSYHANSANAITNSVAFYDFGKDIDAGMEKARRLGFDKPRSSTSDYNIDDDTNDPATATATAPFFSPQGRGSSNLQEQSVFRKQDKNNATAMAFDPKMDKNNPRQSWPFRGFDDSTLDQLTVISVAGVCAELLAFGNAEGGQADFTQLYQLLAYADADDYNNNNHENRIRFALGYTMSQLRRHLGALDALAKIMERGGTIAECIHAIETCDNVSGNDGILLQDYEQQRKQQFQQSTNPILWIIERVFLGEVKTASVQDDRWVQGKGGGYKKDSQEPLLTGDDPLYLALGVATVFLVWASSGGLRLH